MPLAIWSIARSGLFLVDAERVHRIAMSSLRAWSRFCSVDLPSDDVARHPSLAVDAFGLRFPNPVGLAAGFDKDGECIPAWQALGFGFVEVGTVTAQAQPGNPKPRMFRLKEDRALFNRLGFNNHGAAACAARIAGVRAKNRVKIPVGVNIGKTKIVDNDKAADDYAESFRAIADVADYVVVNVSSPNTPGLRDLQKTDELARILDVLTALNAKRAAPRPLLVKIAPDLAVDDAHRCAEVALQSGCAGLVVSNTTISREGLHELPPEGPGGISGAPLFSRSTDLLRTLAASHAKLGFIGVGGVEDGRSAQAKLDAGASLVQSYTGFVYSGPYFTRDVCRSLIVGRPLVGRRREGLVPDARLALPGGTSPHAPPADEPPTHKQDR